MNYFKNIFEGFSSIAGGLKLTLKHIYQARKSHTPSNVFDADYFLQDSGIVTLNYPFESLAIPDNGRYRLHNEIDDCIVCDKCAVVCPVDCIAIEAIKSAEPIGETSDGSVKRLYAGVFDIDMAKCCFCGLCTTVCPTECLTMTKTYDFSEVDIKSLNYHYSNLSPQEAEEKKSLYEQFVKEKEALKSQKAASTIVESSIEKVQEKNISEEIKQITDTNKVENENEAHKPSIPKPKFGKPVIKPTEQKAESVSNVEKPIFDSNQASSLTETKVSDDNIQNMSSAKPVIPKPKFIKPIMKKPDEGTGSGASVSNENI